MSLTNRQHYRFSAITGLLTLLTLAVIGLVHFQNQHRLQNSLLEQKATFLGEYASLLAASARNNRMHDRNSPIDLSLIAHIEGLQKVCVYQGGELTDALYKLTKSICADDLSLAFQDQSARLKSFQSFQPSNGPAGIIALYSGSPPPVANYSEAVVALLLALLAGSIWIAAHGYFRKVQASLGMTEVEQLENICGDVLHHQNYKLRAPHALPGPLKTIGLAINAMLDELQQNELQLQESAIQIQEKVNQLEAQKKLHQDRNQNLQKMFAGASHDLRQPLQAMSIFISAIKEQADQSQLPLVLKLEHVLDNLNGLFTDLLDLSKVESRMQRIPKSTIEVAPLLRKIYDEFEALANEKRIRLRLHESDFRVYSNPNMLERIIRNMISNAIRYTRNGGVLIGSRKRKGEIWIEVWDTGRGIPTDKLTEIFNEFVQIEDRDQGTSKGVGLGLFIVKKLAQLLDHSIIVKSKLRQGTLFRVAVPMAHEPSALPASPNMPPIAPLTGGRKSVTVVLVDDDHTVRSGLKQLMTAWQWQVIDFDDTASAVEYIKSHTRACDVIVTDFQLNEQDTGLDLLHQVRTATGTDYPAILITGTEDPQLLTAIEQSRIPFLKKPVKPAKLRALINVVTHIYP